MIDERREEQACAYAIGALETAEVREFERALWADAELRQLTAELRASTKAIAISAPSMPPTMALKQRVMEAIGSGETKIIQFKPAERSPWVPWIPWAVAACLAGFCVALSVQIQQAMSEGRGLKDRLVALQDEANKAHDDFSHANEQAQLLGKEVIRLKGENRLAEMRISMLNSLLADAPKAIAVSVWDQKNQSGVFVVQNLKPAAADKDYQLWVIDAKAPVPVDAGVFQVDKDGNVRIEFKPHAAIGVPDKFAVTVEPKGGRPTPTGKMVLLGS